jgi:hypothetical protein
MLSPKPGRSPHYWYGPELGIDIEFDLQLAIHCGMGPGGIMWRENDTAAWTSLVSASAWGAERLTWPDFWTIGGGKSGPGDRPFNGRDLAVHLFHERLAVEPG